MSKKGTSPGYIAPESDNDSNPSANTVSQSADTNIADNQKVKPSNSGKKSTNNTTKKRCWSGWRILVLISIAITLMAWFAMVKDEYVSFWTGVVGAVVSLGSSILVGKGVWRDLAITCLIACGVLLLVYVIFYTAINYAINAI